MANNSKFVQAQTFTLAGAGAILGATSITLNSFKQIDGTNLTMTDFGSKGFLTLEPNNGTLEEQVSFSGVTQNSNGTATLTGIKTVLMISPYTETTGLAQTHAGGVPVIITNTAGFYNNFVNKNDDGTVTQTITFTNPNYPRMDTASPFPTDNEQLATKGYADSLTFAGAPDASTTQKGIVQEATTAQVNAGTATGSTGAKLFPSPADLAASIYGLQLPTSGQKDALAGTSGTPSSSNKYVTNDDTSQTGSGTKVVRGTGGKIDNSWLNIKFGGTGADGALTASSGATNINLAGAAVVVKNYTSISLTGTATLTFSNPHANGTCVVLKSQGAVTITSSGTPVIDLRGIGAAKDQDSLAPVVGAKRGGQAGTSTAGIGGRGSYTKLSASSKCIVMIPGSGGGTGAAGGSAGTPGAGGAGGGALYIECGGALNITGVINASGGAGSDGTSSGSAVTDQAGGGGGAGAAGDGATGGVNGGGSSNQAGGGGGGGGGTIQIIATSISANSGTYTVSAGAASTGPNGSGGGVGAAGSSSVSLNTELY